MEKPLLVHQGPMVIPELGVEVYFGKEPLRHDGTPNVLGLIGIATANGLKEEDAYKILARQLYIYNNPHIPDRKHNVKTDYPNVNQPIPFFVSQTTLAMYKYGIGEFLVDPYEFVKNRSYHEPSDEDLKRNGYYKEDLERVKSQPAKLAGSLVVVYFGYDDYRQTILIPRKGYYKNKWTIPGGHFDNPYDVAGLAEAIEEIDVEPKLLKNALPLGSVDQVIFTGDPNKPKLERYLNLVWQSKVLDTKDLEGYEQKGCKIDEEEVRREDMTPIAQKALEMAGYF